MKRYKNKHFYCSIQCCNKQKKGDRTAFETSCHRCGKKFKTTPGNATKSKSGLLFCSKSCSISFHNTQRRKSRRSKCEKILFDRLAKEFPDLNIISNDKIMLGGLELDIAIPELKLGIEWNGVVHFRPIYGFAKLDRIQELDAKKVLTAQKLGIELIVVPDLVSTDSKIQEAFFDISKRIRIKLLDKSPR